MTEVWMKLKSTLIRSVKKPWICLLSSYTLADDHLVVWWDPAKPTSVFPCKLQKTSSSWASYGCSRQEWCRLILFLSMRESDPIFCQTPGLARSAFWPHKQSSIRSAVFAHSFKFSLSSVFCAAWLKRWWWKTLSTWIWFDLGLQLMMLFMIDI